MLFASFGRFFVNKVFPFTTMYPMEYNAVAVKQRNCKSITGEVRKSWKV